MHALTARVQYSHFKVNYDPRVFVILTSNEFHTSKFECDFTVGESLDQVWYVDPVADTCSGSQEMWYSQVLSRLGPEASETWLSTVAMVPNIVESLL